MRLLANSFRDLPIGRKLRVTRVPMQAGDHRRILGASAQVALRICGVWGRTKVRGQHAPELLRWCRGVVGVAIFRCLAWVGRRRTRQVSSWIQGRVGCWAVRGRLPLVRARMCGAPQPFWAGIGRLVFPFLCSGGFEEALYVMNGCWLQCTALKALAHQSTHGRSLECLPRRPSEKPVSSAFS